MTDFSRNLIFACIGQKAPKIGYPVSFLERFVIWFSLEHPEKKIIVILDFPSQIPWRERF